MKRVTRDDAYKFVVEVFLPKLYNDFEEIYPDAFTKSKTLDTDVYKNSNPHMNFWFLQLSNSLMKLPETPGVYVQDWRNSDYSYIVKMYEDYCKCDGLGKLKFLIQFTSKY